MMSQRITTSHESAMFFKCTLINTVQPNPWFSSPYFLFCCQVQCNPSSVSHQSTAGEDFFDFPFALKAAMQSLETECMTCWILRQKLIVRQNEHVTPVATSRWFPLSLGTDFTSLEPVFFEALTAY